MGPLTSVIALQRSARRSTVSPLAALATADRRLPEPPSLQLVTGTVAADALPAWLSARIPTIAPARLDSNLPDRMLFISRLLLHGCSTHTLASRRRHRVDAGQRSPDFRHAHPWVIRPNVHRHPGHRWLDTTCLISAAASF